jgi:hypothetical protein
MGSLGFPRRHAKKVSLANGGCDVDASSENLPRAKYHSQTTGARRGSTYLPRATANMPSSMLWSRVRFPQRDELRCCAWHFLAVGGNDGSRRFAATLISKGERVCFAYIDVARVTVDATCSQLTLTNDAREDWESVPLLKPNKGRCTR